MTSLIVRNVEVIKFREPVPMNTDNRLLRKMCACTFSFELNTQRFRMPFKNLWYWICTGIPDSADEIIFMFWETFTLSDRNYRKYLKNIFLIAR